MTDFQGGGKMPPQAIDLEEAVLGAALTYKDSFGKVRDMLSSNSFYKAQHIIIWNALDALDKENEPIEVLSVVHKLKATGELDMAGGAYYISKLTNKVATDDNILYHARIIIQKQKQRDLIRLGSEMIQEGYDETSDVFETIEKAEKEIFNISQISVEAGSSYQENVVNEAISDIDAAIEMKRSGKIIGVTSGFKEIDQYTHGWFPTDLIILAARPSVGKTTLAVNICNNIKEPVGIISQEMKEATLLSKCAVSDLKIDAEKVKAGDLTSEQRDLFAEKIKSYKDRIYIINKPGLKIGGLRQQAHKWKSEHDIKLLVVDYLQLISGDDKHGREQEISKISRGLKALALELKIPIIALSQLSRAVEAKADRKPNLSNLRESGAIEQDADIVLFLWRPEHYLKNEELIEQGYDKLYTEVICPKHRGGKLFTAKLAFYKDIQLFTDYDDALPKFVDKGSGQWVNDGDDDDPVDF